MRHLGNLGAKNVQSVKGGEFCGKMVDVEKSGMCIVRVGGLGTKLNGLQLMVSSLSSKWRT